MPADLARKDSCIYCGVPSWGALPVRHLTHDGTPRYVHPSCVAKALAGNPADFVARACATRHAPGVGPRAGRDGGTPRRRAVSVAPWAVPQRLRSGVVTAPGGVKRCCGAG